MQNLTKDQWIVTEEGICQVISTHDYYIEEYSLEYLEGNSDIGDFSKTICVYKILCDYEGNIRKRNIVKYANAKYFGPVSKKYKPTIEKVKKESPDEFERFIKFTSKKKPFLVETFFFCYEEQSALNDLKLAVEEIGAELGDAFSFQDFKDAVIKEKLDINFSKANINSELRPADFIIALYNNDLIVRNKQAIFAGLRVIVSDWRSVAR